MPKVSRPVQTARPIVNAPVTYSNLQVTPDQITGGAGDRLIQQGQIEQQRAIQMKDEDDVARVKELDAQFSAAVRDNLYLGDDAYYRRKGREAYDTLGEARSGLEELRKQYLEQVGNDNQRKLLSQASMGRLNTSFDAMTRHASAERLNWQNSANEARAAEEAQSAIAAWRNPTEVKVHIRAGGNELAEIMERAGASQEEIRHKLETYESEVHLGVIKTMVDASPEAAELYFKQNQERIDVEKHESARNLLEAETTLHKVHQAADQIWNLTGTDEEKLAAARTLSGKVREGVVSEIKTRMAERKVLDGVQNQQAFDMALNIVRQPGAKISLIPSATRGLLKPDQMATLERELTRIRRGELVVTNSTLWNTFQSMAYEEPEAFLKVNLNTLVDQIEQPDLDKLYSLQRAMKGAGGKDLDYFTEVQNVRTQVNQLFEDPKSDEAIQMHRRVQMELTKQEAAAKRKMTPIEKQELVNSVYRDVMTHRGMVWDTKKPAYQIQVEGVPEFWMQDIISILEESNLEVSDENILKAYQAMGAAQ
ncbi:MAG: hypothetical protein AB2784_20950 [Candidatus Thiodiazotropha endolucinida]